MRVASTAAEAVSSVRDGDTVLVGGFGDMGVPYNLLEALADSLVSDLTIVNSNGGDYELGLPRLVRQGQVRRLITAAGGAPGGYHTRDRHAEGKLEVELVSQGVLAERVRAGAAGIAAFFTRVGATTELAAGKPCAEIDGVPHVLEKAIRADVAFVKAHRSDECGNLVYRGGLRNYNPVMAVGARHTIAEVDEVVPSGTIDPEHVITPGVFVDVVVAVPGRSQGLNTVVDAERRAELSTRPAVGLSRWELARQVGVDLPSGALVNLGTGMPCLVVGAGSRHDVLFHTEQGIIGVSGFAESASSDEIQMAGRQMATVAPGAVFQSSSDSFLLAASGRLDVSVMGALEVSTRGDLANWLRPGWALGTVGGAMDFATGAGEVWVMMTHTDPKGRSKLKEVCELPITGERCVTRVYTELGRFELVGGEARLTAIAPGVSLDHVRASTSVDLVVADDLETMGDDQ